MNGDLRRGARSLAARRRGSFAIWQANVEAAAAVFDAVLFADVGFSDSNQPTPIPVINGVPLGTGSSTSRSWAFDTGIRKPLESGGSFVVSTDATRVDNQAPGFTYAQPGMDCDAVRLGFSQPLLRVRQRRERGPRLRRATPSDRGCGPAPRPLQQLVFDVEQAYWDLVVAREAQDGWWSSATACRDDVAARDFDTRQAQYSDAVATVEQRKGQRGARPALIRLTSGQLKELVNDPQVSLESEVLVAAVDFLADAPVSASTCARR
ncbi:MAG: hypothetical protein U0575_11545 [Phycisphaerales bacterium]